MLALTLWQPWAALILAGAKTIETRGWGTRYRGTLAIHAGIKAIPRDWYGLKADPNVGPVLRRIESFPLGQMVGTCRLVDCERITEASPLALTDLERACGDYRPGRFAWTLTDVQPLVPPVFVKGGQGLWKWEPPKTHPLAATPLAAQ